MLPALPEDFVPGEHDVVIGKVRVVCVCLCLCLLLCWYCVRVCVGCCLPLPLSLCAYVDGWRPKKKHKRAAFLHCALLSLSH